MGFLKTPSGVPGCRSPTGRSCLGQGVESSTGQSQGPGGLLEKPRSTPSQLNSQIAAGGPGWVPEAGRAVEKELGANLGPSLGLGCPKGFACQPWMEAMCLLSSCPLSAGLLSAEMRPHSKSVWEPSPFLFTSGGIIPISKMQSQRLRPHDLPRVSVRGCSSRPFCPRERQILLLGLWGLCRAGEGLG